jgi:dTMP kinase
MFITFEGIDGSGKTSASRELNAALRDRGYDVLLTREPGGTSIGDQIRSIVLDNKANTMMNPNAELLLFCASRAQLVAEVIRPRLAQDGIVLCDRYADSTLAYQGYGHGLPKTPLKQILKFATGGLVPDVTLYLDLDPRAGLERRKKGRLLNSEDWNRLDAMELRFHKRVYAGYEKLIAASPARWQRIDASQPLEKVVQAMLAVLLPRLPKKD